MPYLPWIDAPSVTTGLDFATLWGHGEPFPYFQSQIRQLKPLWDGAYRHAEIPPWALEAYGKLPNGLLMLALNADWCLDSATTIPLLARLAERVPGVELRLLERDRWPEVMDQYPTDGTRSIPLVILLDRDFRELGQWGPRPAELQSWVRAHLTDMTKEERQWGQRRWYARDRGETVLREILQVLSTGRTEGSRRIGREEHECRV